MLTPTESREFFPGPLLGQLRALAPECELVDPTELTAAAIEAKIAAFNPEVLVACWKTPRLPADLPARLRYICYLVGSLKKLLDRRHLDGRAVVTNWGGSISRTVAEAALFHVLACLRNSSHWAIAMHQPGVAAWKNGPHDSRSLFSRRVGLHGFGPVARELVALLRPWNCPVTVFAPDVTDDLARGYGIERATSLDTLFAENEILVELAPLIPATTGIVTEKILRLIRPGGVFVNVGRGAVVDEAALLRLAHEGNIAIGLDVFTQEPLPADSGFRALPHVSLTPHTAGPTIDRYPDAGAFALENLRAYAADRPLEAIVTPEIFDQSS
ncbi:MAG: NAD(P)-dependent oxidoreductase [Opitutaceae bacterium]